MQTATYFETELGWFGIKSTPAGIAFLTFGNRTRAEAAKRLGERMSGGPSAPAWLQDAQGRLQDFASGFDTDLSRIPLDLAAGTPFQERVRKIVQRLRFGETASYGEVAAMAGVPGAARAVGTVMSKNPVPLLIPCHRVLGAGGKLGGYSAPQGLQMKQRLLEMEQAAVLSHA
ncbi:methylated-DNA--[protein]-cysteine S-methyltransferase [Planctomicrobium sp. SH664]|uniref:methylated-DNA--[protein]-cysteine S-methyltransferase n=1 Tax=Planctomicrobium sp. SH664 TaxID=3448125 RepID=UPI003F5C9DA5